MIPVYDLQTGAPESLPFFFWGGFVGSEGYRYTLN